MNPDKKVEINITPSVLMAAREQAARDGSLTQFFDPKLLDRCRMSDEDAKRFRDEARQRCLRDEATGAVVVCYVHPDGRILIDAIRLRSDNPFTEADGWLRSGGLETTPTSPIQMRDTSGDENAGLEL